MARVTFIDDDSISFDDGSNLYSNHDTDCCESHFLSFSDLTLEDFSGLEFDLSSDDFFERVEDYGIRLLPTNGQPVSVPGYGYNNGYYSSHLDLVLEKDGSEKQFDISDCQVVSD